MRSTHRIIIAFITVAVFSTLVFGCSSKLIRPGTNEDVSGGVKEGLESEGFVCKRSERDASELVCDSPRTYKTTISYFSQSKRLQFMSVFNLLTPCTEIYADIMAFNWNYNVAQASCNGNNISFVSTIILPESGLKSVEIKEFLEWWRDTMNETMKDSKLWDYVE